MDKIKNASLNAILFHNKMSKFYLIEENSRLQLLLDEQNSANQLNNVNFKISKFHMKQYKLEKRILLRLIKSKIEEFNELKEKYSNKN